MDRLRDLVWKFWPMYCRYKNWKHGRGGWKDFAGYQEVARGLDSYGYLIWEWESCEDHLCKYCGYVG